MENVKTYLINLRKINYRAVIKFIITLFYLFASIITSYCIFQYMLYSSKTGMENVMLSILYSVGLSAFTIFLLGLLSIFTHFIFVKLIYSDEVKNAAYVLLQNKRKEIQKSNTDESDEVEQINS